MPGGVYWSKYGMIDSGQNVLRNLGWEGRWKISVSFNIFYEINFQLFCEDLKTIEFSYCCVIDPLMYYSINFMMKENLAN